MDLSVEGLRLSDADADAAMDLSVEGLRLSDADADADADADGGGGEDRLSALPDDLLIHILGLVANAAEAARTSILSRRWRRSRLWAVLPELSFFFIEHHGIGDALAAHEAPDLTLLLVLTEDAPPESVSAWLPVAARNLSGHLHLQLQVAEAEAEAEGRGAIDLPCFEKATTITLNLGFLDLALPPSGVFARLEELQLIGIQLHGQPGLGDLLSSQRCPSLHALRVRDVRGLDSFNIHSESLRYMELFHMVGLQQLTVIAPALTSFKMSSCFSEPLNPEISVAKISAPQLTSLDWMNYYNPSSIRLDKRMHLEWLGIPLCILHGDDEPFGNNFYGMKLLRRFERIHTLDLMITYPRGICTGPYFMEHMPRLPCVKILALGIVACGHSFGASLFDVLRRCTGVKRLDFDFVPEIQLEEQSPCPSGCICDQLPNWRTEKLALDCLEEIEIHGMRGTELEVALVQRIFHWATVVKRMKIVFHESITESKDKELRQLLLSFSRPDICMDISIFVP